ncbi:IS1182 family transposase [Methylotuvimicrobium alcaliphilum]|uniref:Transposase n=1 Tax=Methylotuvimicrobium alcaliphilum (strain DSM 19304 / NCIMB 14124 / VKM B-2133 / 20Z) TaxID=1091494 RepID=G4T3C6_META2|nr:IS1182 family transposase [Methylotuvimicrobium alcaliphilum]CCE22618.1 transposase [Methylotuvimicrobium alcaliphilum 20Z]
MSSRRYHRALNRQQDMLLPLCIDDYVSQNNPVRAIDAYVDTLDLYVLGFKNTEPVIGAGQPAYDPAALLKLYLYGYLQGIRSSRKLERETTRNLEVMWLIAGLQPTYKTIADFRQGNSDALKAANRDFLLLCKELTLFGGEQVAVDGSFFNANASKAGIYTEDKLNKQLEKLSRKIADYQQALAEQDSADDRASLGSLVEDEQLPAKLEQLQTKQAEKKALLQQLKTSGDKQVSTVDPDARLLTKRGQTVSGYNVQIAVDDRHKLIVVDEVTQAGNDVHQLAPMMAKAQETLQSESLTGLADSGYFEGNQLKSCEDQNTPVYVAIPDKSKAIAAKGRLTREQFSYDPEQNAYCCPQGKLLTVSGKAHQKNGKWMTGYKSKPADCSQCPLREHCLTEKATIKQIQRWEHEDVIERHRQRMEQQPGIMKKRAALVEHPFGTLKHRAGMNHFLMRGLEKCRGEFSLMVLAYNFTRLLTILGADALRDYCVRRPGNTLKNMEYA